MMVSKHTISKLEYMLQFVSRIQFYWFAFIISRLQSWLYFTAWNTWFGPLSFKPEESEELKLLLQKHDLTSV